MDDEAGVKPVKAGAAGPAAAGGGAVAPPPDSAMPLRWRLAGYAACAAATVFLAVTYRIFFWPFRIFFGDLAHSLWAGGLTGVMFLPLVFALHLSILFAACWVVRKAAERALNPARRRVRYLLLIPAAAGLASQRSRMERRRFPHVGCYERKRRGLGAGVERI